MNVVHAGRPLERYEALMDGKVDAVGLMEPWIALAEKNGCKSLGEAHYTGADIAAPDMDEAIYSAMQRAIKRGVQLFNANKRKYLHHLIEEIPAHLGRLAEEDFHLPRLRYMDPAPYSEAEFRHYLRVDAQLGPYQREHDLRRPGRQPHLRRGVATGLVVAGRTGHDRRCASRDRSSVVSESTGSSVRLPALSEPYAAKSTDDDRLEVGAQSRTLGSRLAGRRVSWGGRMRRHASLQAPICGRPGGRRLLCSSRSRSC